MKTDRNRMIAVIAVYSERYVLSFVYLCFALSSLHDFTGILSGRIGQETTEFFDATHQLTLFLFSLFTSLLLLLARRTTVPPQKLQFVLVPLVTTFFTFLYYAVSCFPPSWQANVCPPACQVPVFAAGLLCIIIGPAFAFWGILHLGRSFGIYVNVRKIVMTGPYRWVRHPMYLGWTIFIIGFVLTNFSYAYILLVAIHLALMLYRANLEQTQLAAHSTEYREYMKHTGFIFPRLPNPFSRRRNS
jgi:protein-S-isoprenylcysteine O-methyltransferase Ste14